MTTSGAILNQGSNAVAANPGGASLPLVSGAAGAVGTTGVVVVSGGNVVFSGTTLFGAAIEPFETEYVLQGGTATSSVVSGLGMALVSAGGLAIGTVVSAGGVIEETGGVASGTVVSSGGEDLVMSGGTASYVAVSSGGYEEIDSGGSASFTAISSGGYALVNSGGTVVGTEIGSGGALLLLPGAVASGTMVQSGGVQANVALVSGTSLVSAASGTVTGMVVSADETQYVLAGGIASASVVSGALGEGGPSVGFGTEMVYSGGSAVGTTLAGGTAIVFSGGILSGDMVNSLGVEEVVGGVASGTMVNSGGQELVGGEFNLRSPLFGNGQVGISGGGTASGTMIGSGGYEAIYSGGVAQGAMIGSGGSAAVFAGGVASGFMVSSGGFLLVSSGGLASGTTLNSGGEIDLTYLPYASGGSVNLDSTTGELTVTEGGQSVTLQLLGTFPGEQFYLSHDSAEVPGTDIGLVACFAEGTRVLTDRGEVPVETLAVGDHLVRATGGPAPVVWLGHRRVVFSRHPRPRELWPVRILPGAFGPGRPKRALRISPDHAVYIHGHLIPARLLINGGSIAQERCDAVTYWHVELPSHGVIFAEGLESESYLDTGNRTAFEGAEVTDLHPSFDRTAENLVAASGCAPLLRSGPILDALRARLAERSASLGASCAREVVMRIDRAGIASIMVPRGTGVVRLASSAAMPPGERRWLGAAVASVALDGDRLALDDARLERGFHPLEGAWRWTDGEGILTLSPSGKLRELVVEIAAVVERAVA